MQHHRTSNFLLAVRTLVVPGKTEAKSLQQKVLTQMTNKTIDTTVDTPKAKAKSSAKASKSPAKAAAKAKAATHAAAAEVAGKARLRPILSRSM